MVTVSNIQVHKAGSDEEEGWLTLFSVTSTTPEPMTFDLVQVTGIEEVLGTQEFAVGKYTQIRMDVEKVMVTHEGEEKEATLPGDKLKVVGQFDVEEGQATVLTLDFDADKSVVITGSGRVQFKPTVKLLIRKEDRRASTQGGSAGQRGSGAGGGGGGGGQGGRGGAGQAGQARPGASPSQAGALTIAVPPTGIQALALSTAIEAGYLDEHGIEVVLSTLDNGIEVLRALRQGGVPMAVLPMFQVIQSTNSPRPLVAVGAIGGSINLNVVVAGAVAQQRGVTPESPLEERLAALEGLVLGHPPGLLGVNTARGVLERAGLDPDQDVELVPVPGAEQVAALRDGRIDAFVGHHPYLEQAIVNDGAVLLLNLTGGELPSLGAFPHPVLATTPGYLEQGAEVLRAVLSGLRDAQAAIRQDSTVAARALESAFPDLSGPILAEGIAIYVPGVPESPLITQEAYDTAIRVFGVNPAPFEQVVDNSFIETE